MKHAWKVKEAGNWYTEYVCEACGQIEVEEPDSSYRKPEDGCGDREQAVSLASKTQEPETKP